MALPFKLHLPSFKRVNGHRLALARSAALWFLIVRKIIKPSIIERRKHYSYPIFVIDKNSDAIAVNQENG